MIKDDCHKSVFPIILKILIGAGKSYLQSSPDKLLFEGIKDMIKLVCHKINLS